MDVTRVFTASALGGRNLEEVFSELRDRAVGEMKAEGFHDVELEELVDMRYRGGQSFEITVNYRGGGTGLREAFEAEHRSCTATSPPTPWRLLRPRWLPAQRSPSWS